MTMAVSLGAAYFCLKYFHRVFVPTLFEPTQVGVPLRLSPPQLPADYIRHVRGEPMVASYLDFPFNPTHTHTYIYTA